MIITFALLHTPPVPWARARRGGGRSYTDPRVKTYKRALVAAWHAEARGRTFGGEARLEVRVCVAWCDRRRRDVDNLAKCVLDALQGHAFGDDAQIDRLVVTRVRPEHTGGVCGVVVCVADYSPEPPELAWHTSPLPSPEST